MLGFIALTYLAGRITGKQEWVALAKVELSELIKSVIIFAVIVLVYILLNTFLFYVLTSMANVDIESSSSIIEYVVQILSNISISLQNHYIELAEIIHQMKLFSEAWSKVGPGTLHLRLTVYPGVDALMQPLDTLEVIAQSGIYSLTAQILGFKLIEIATAYLLFPVGLIFRLVPITRQAGNELIAMGIVFSLLMPFMYALFYASLADIFHKHEPHGWKNIVEDAKHTGSKGSSLTAFQGVWKGISKLVILSSPLMIYVTQNMVEIIHDISWLFLFAIGIPTFAVTLAGSLIKGVSAFLNLDANLSILNR